MVTHFDFQDCTDEESTSVMDITMQITETWDEEMENQLSYMFGNLSEKYGDQFDAVLELIDGFVSADLTELWQPEESEEGDYFRT